MAQAQDEAETENEIVMLSPFTVNDSQDDGYRASNTLAGTRLKTDLRDLGAALSVVTEQFLIDTGATNTQDLLVYTTNTEVGGQNGNFGGFGSDVVVNETSFLLTPNTNTRVRGLGSADNARDFSLTDIPWDSYNVDRVDLQRGPNSILFGLGKPAGLINANLKQPKYKNENSVSTRLDGFGSARASLHLNRVLLDKELAVRVDGLEEQKNYRQEPAYTDQRRLFGALRYEPKFLRKGSAWTTLRAHYEHGRILSNNPRSLPPVDQITPWFETGTTTVNGTVFNNLNKKTFDHRYSNAFFANVPDSGFRSRTSANYQPSIVDLVGGIRAYFDNDPSGAAIGNYYVPITRGWTEDFGLNPQGGVEATINGLFGTLREGIIGTTSQIARAMGLPFAFDYKNKTLTDPSIFDFYHHLIDGPTRLERREFDAFNVTLSQTFLNNRLGIEAVYDRQSYEDSVDALLGNDGITVDIAKVYADLTPNPNVGRPMVTTRSLFPSRGNQTEREDRRVTAFAELRAHDFLERSWLTKLLGRHVFTGVLNRSSYENSNQTWASYGISNPSSAYLDPVLGIQREVYIVQYLGPEMSGRSSAAGLGLPGIPHAINPGQSDLVFFDSKWDRPTNPTAAGYVNPAARWVNPFNNQNLTQSENPENYVGWRELPTTFLSATDGDRAQLTNNAGKSRDRIKSEVFVWQGYLWDGLVVPMFGYRNDTARAYNVTGVRNAEGVVDLDDPAFVLSDSPNNIVSGTTKTYSVVMHTPKFIADRLPADLNFSIFYNRSDNFEPAANRVDVLANPLDAPMGRTTDVGVAVSAFNNRAVLKINRYKSVVQGTSYNLANMFVLGNIETSAWVHAKRYEAGLTGNPLYAGEEYNYGAMVDGQFVQTAADRALQEEHVRAILDNFPAAIGPAWNIAFDEAGWQNDRTEYNQQGGSVPVGLIGGGSGGFSAPSRQT